MGVPRLTDHAVERYHERLQRSFDFKRAKADLIRLLPYGEFSEEPPRWLKRNRIDPEVTGYWTMGDVCLVLCGKRVAVTCVTRGGLPPATRLSRNRRRRARKQRLALARGC